MNNSLKTETEYFEMPMQWAFQNTRFRFLRTQ